MAVLFIGASLFGLNGCATTGSYAVKGTDYNQFYDTNGEYKLVGRNNDIYLEKLDKSESKRITNTPSITERVADFSKDGKYILYMEEHGSGLTDITCYLIERGKDDKDRKEISITEYGYIKD